MMPNLETAADSRELLVICVVFASMAAVFLPILFFSIAEDRRLRKRMQERAAEREHQRVELLRLIDENIRRNQQARLEQEVQRQLADNTAVTLPITLCERRDRRRRFLPLEEHTNESH
jgi:serine phosphatase RsbU (regulator of sigma subunit)